MEVKETGEEKVQRNVICMDVFPNPSNNHATISYTVTKPADVTCSIYDAMGRKVITLTSGYHAEGSYTHCWNGIDDKHQMVESGVYFVRATTPDGESQQKLVLLK